MKATGRRIGRIIGQLDDLYTLVNCYFTAENDDGDVRGALEELRSLLGRAYFAAEGVSEEINKRDGRGK